MISKLHATALTAVAIAGMAAPAAFAGGDSVTQTSQVTVSSTSPKIYDVGTLNRQFTSITLTASGITRWCGDPNQTCYTDAYGRGTDAFGNNPNPNVGHNPDQPAYLPNVHVGTIAYKVGPSGPWKPLTVGGVTITSATPAHVFVAYNDDGYADNSGSYVLTVTRAKPGDKTERDEDG
jgi:hypothetical protein